MKTNREPDLGGPILEICFFLLQDYYIVARIAWKRHRRTG